MEWQRQEIFSYEVNHEIDQSHLTAGKGHFVNFSLANEMNNIQVSLFKNIFESSQNSLPVTVNEKCSVIQTQL